MLIQLLVCQFFAELSDFVRKISRFLGSVNLIWVDLIAPLIEFDIRIPSFNPNFLHAAAKVIKSKVCSSLRTLILLIIILKINSFVIIKIHDLLVTLTLHPYAITR